MKAKLLCINLFLWGTNLASEINLKKFVKILPPEIYVLEDIKIDKKGTIHFLWREKKWSQQNGWVKNLFYGKMKINKEWIMPPLNLGIEAKGLSGVSGNFLSCSPNKAALLVKKSYGVEPLKGDNMVSIVFIDEKGDIKKEQIVLNAQESFFDNRGIFHLFYNKMNGFFYEKFSNGKKTFEKKFYMGFKELKELKEKGELPDVLLELGKIFMTSKNIFLITSIKDKKKIIKKETKIIGYREFRTGEKKTLKREIPVFEHNYFIQYYSLDTLANLITKPSEIEWEKAKKIALLKFTLPDSIKKRIPHTYLAPSKDGGVLALFKPDFKDTLIVLKFNKEGKLERFKSKNIKPQNVNSDFWWDVFLKKENIKPPEIKLLKDKVFLYGMDNEGNFYWSMEKL